MKPRVRTRTSESNREGRIEEGRKAEVRRLKSGRSKVKSDGEMDNMNFTS